MKPNANATKCAWFFTRGKMFAAVFSFLLALSEGNVAGAPYIPDNDAIVLEKLRSGPVDKETREIRQLRRLWEQDPKNVTLATQLSRRLISKSRQTSDPRYLGQAESVLADWWANTNAPVEVILLRATILQSTHHFTAALADLDLALALDPRNAQAWLTRATILQVTGDYEGARRACVPLREVASELIAVTSLGSVRSLTGDAAGAYQSIHDGLRRATSVSPEERIWAVTLLAEIAVRLGRDAEADGHFTSALAMGERDPYLLGAYADFLLDQKKPARVLALLEGETRSDALLLRLALAEKTLGDPKTSAHIALLKSRFEASAQRGDKVHQREEARFQLHLLGDHAAALSLALANFNVQREPADVRILLEAAQAAGDMQARGIAAQFVSANHLEDLQVQRLLDAKELR